MPTPKDSKLNDTRSSKKRACGDTSASSASPKRLKETTVVKNLSKKIPKCTLESDRDLAKLKKLEAELHSSKTHLNNIVQLLLLCQSRHHKVVHAAAHALHRVFSSALEKGELVRSKAVGKKTKTKAETEEEDAAALLGVKDWLRDNYIQYLNRLIDLLQDPEPGLQVPALELLMDIIRREAAITGLIQKSAPVFPANLYERAVRSLLTNPNTSDALKSHLTEKYLVIFDDIRYFTLKSLTKIVKSAVEKAKLERADRKSASTSLSTIVKNGFYLLEAFRTMPTVQSEVDEFWAGHPAPASSAEDNFMEGDLSGDEPASGKTQKSKSIPPLLLLSVHRRAFSEAWIAYLQLPLPSVLYKRVLLMMHKKIIPHMPHPALLIDFLTESYDAGGVISLLALNGLFTLINEHNLDYPHFYSKLYALLDRDVMHVKYRSRFFRMLDLFLTSTHVPAYMAAAFAKRLARLSLSAPPAANVVIMPMIYNLMKRHPAVLKLIHRGPAGLTLNASLSGDDDGTEQETAPARDDGVDTYNHLESDPAKSGALQSSLWELKTLREHYTPNVSSLAKMFEEKFNKPNYALEDFLDHTYATIFESDAKKPIMKTPAVTFEAQPALADEASGYTSIWSF